MANTLFRIKGKFIKLILLAGVIICSYDVFGYVMPAEQILDFMIKNFSGFRTITLIQSTLQTKDGAEKVFTEQLWLESPDKYSTKPLDRLAERDVFSPDILYHQFFMTSDIEKIERILLTLGIDITKTSLTRLDGEIAYRIGDKDPASPKLIIEKKRFFPLLLVYRVPDRPENELITVRFEDYQKQDKGWFPFEITYKEGENLTEKYTIQNFQTDIPIDASILKSFPEYELPESSESETGSATSGPEEQDIDKERLQNVIKAFEEQYQ
ncbi:MAG: hypothetical protein JXL81_10295 [Deltaproteobacteria bacterium]|nr:hypothetical protein [Deltaproteobacteria bacterium]